MVLMKKMVRLKYLHYKKEKNNIRNDFSYSGQYSDKPQI